MILWPIAACCNTAYALRWRSTGCTATCTTARSARTACGCTPRPTRRGRRSRTRAPSTSCAPRRSASSTRQSGWRTRNKACCNTAAVFERAFAMDVLESERAFYEAVRACGYGWSDIGNGRVVIKSVAGAAPAERYSSLHIPTCVLQMAHFYDTDFPCATLMRLEKLRVLDISYCSLYTLPDTICDLRWLRCLSVNRNNLVTLPDEIARLCHLRALDMCDNPFTTGLPDEFFGMSALKYIRIGPNQIAHFATDDQKRFIANRCPPDDRYIRACQPHFHPPLLPLPPTPAAPVPPEPRDIECSVCFEPRRSPTHWPWTCAPQCTGSVCADCIVSVLAHRNLFQFPRCRAGRK